MEELSEDHVESLKQRREWVKFEEDGRRVNGDGDPGSDPAVISVENGPKTARAAGDDEEEVTRDGPTAVIEATQIHVSVDRRPGSSTPTGAAPAPSPAPRGVATVAPAAGSPVEQAPPRVASRSGRSTPKTQSPAPASLPVATVTGTPMASGHQPAGGRSGRGAERNEMIIQMPLRSELSTSAAGPAHEMQTVSLADGATSSTSNGVVGSMGPLRDVRKITTSQAFANGDILVTVLPQNDKCPWLTRAEFRPELVPEELMSQHLTLTVEEYLSAMEVLVNDFRFNCYNICYKRILMAWILLGFLVLLIVLFSGVRGVALFGAGVIWLLLNASGIFVCMWVKIRLRYHLEGCVAQVNKHFLKHKIMVGVDDRGKLSCHKVNLIFVYFDCTDCVHKLNEMIETEDKVMNSREVENANKRNQFHSRMDIDESDIIITGNTNTRIARQQELGERLLLRYSQRWVKEYVCKRLDLSVDTYDRLEGDAPIQPRHCVSARCPCQFIEEHLRYKPRGKFCGCQLLDF